MTQQCGVMTQSTDNARMRRSIAGNPKQPTVTHYDNGTVSVTDIEGKHWFGCKDDWEVYKPSFERLGRIVGRCLP